MGQTRKILLVEDNAGDAALLQGILEQEAPGQLALHCAGSLGDAMACLVGETFDAILLDLTLPDSTGLDTLNKVCAAAPSLPILVMTGLTDERIARQAVDKGAQDYLVKGQMGGRSVARAVHYAIHRKQIEGELQRARADLEMKVSQRTAELEMSVTALQTEVRNREQAQEQLRQANRILRMVSECNQALVRAEDERGLIGEICRIVLELGGYRMTWVGYAENDAAKSVRPMGSIGFEAGYLEKARITWGDEPLGRGPTGTAIRTGRVVVGRDFLTDPELAPWREQAIQRGYRSSIALPLAIGGKAFGALTIYADAPNGFDTAAKTILAEMADDLAFGITALRTRGLLRQSRRQLQQVVHSAPVVIWAVDAQGICVLADGHLAPLGLTAEQLLGRRMPDALGDRPDIRDHVQRALGGARVAAVVEYGGAIFEARYSPVLGDNGGIAGVMCVATDITERRRAEQEVLSATEAERRRIGRDLHDTVQSGLAGVGFMLGAVQKKLTADGNDSAPDVAHIADIVRGILAQARGLARGLCPIDLKADGLAKALDHLAITTGGLFQIDCQFTCPRPVLIEDESAATQLYYIGQEAVNNAIKHAQAKRISIRLDRREGKLALAVEDNGVGIPDTACPTGGMGLRTMNYRATMIGAALSVRRGQAGGTVVHCSMRDPTPAPASETPAPTDA
jgi:PAS domain S-box-containing protein